MLPLSWMVHVVSFKRRNGVNAVDGTPAYGALATMNVRIEKHTKLMRDRTGKEINVGHQMVSCTKILYDDEFWFPSIGGEPADDTSSDDNARTPLAIEVATNKAGVEVMWTVGFT